MQVDSVRARNILSYDELEIQLHELNIIVGPNNAGKSNLFRLFDIVQDVIISNQFENPELLQHRADRTGFAIELGVSFDKMELSLLERFLRLYIRGVECTTPNQNLTWSKNFVPEQMKRFRKVFLDSFADSFARRLTESMARGTVKLEYLGFPGQFPLIRYMVPVIAGVESAIVLNDSNLTLGSSTSGDTVLKLLTNFITQVTNDKEHPSSFEQALVLAEDANHLFEFASSNGWNIFQINFNYNEIYNRDADLLAKVTQLAREVGLNYSVGGQLSLGQFLFKLIQDSLVIAEEFRGRPDETFGFGEESALGRTSESERLATTLFWLMTGDDASKVRYQQIRDAFTGIFDRKFQFDVSSKLVTVDGQRKIHIGISIKNITLDKSIPIRYTGAGMAEVLYILTLVIGFQRKVIFLDEPASHLHPSTQRRLLDELTKVNRNNQLLVITHSPFMIPTNRLSDVARFYLEEGVSHHKMLVENKNELSRIIKMVERSPQLLSAIFSEKVMLFEGEYEQAALLTWFPKCSPPVILYDENVEYVSVGGQSSFPSYYSLLESWRIPCFAIGDHKAKEATMALKEKFLFKENDLSELLEAEYREVFEAACREFPARQGGKNTQIARYVAERTIPPSEVVDLCQAVRKFIGA